MAGTWDVVAKDDALGAPPAVMAFDEAGNFAGGPERADLCLYPPMHGTYALGSGRFQLTTAVKTGQCDWWMRALCSATFDTTCNQLSVSRISDACDSRGYFDEPTTLTRRLPAPASR